MLGKPGEDELVDAVGAFVSAVEGRRVRTPDGQEGPMPLPFRSLLDPSSQNLSIGVRESLCKRCRRQISKLCVHIWKLSSLKRMLS